MKKTILIILLSYLFLSCCNLKQINSIDNKIIAYKNEIVLTEKELNKTILETYLEYIKKTNLGIPIYAIDAQLVGDFNKTHPEAKKLRDEFDRVNQLKLNIINQYTKDFNQLNEKERSDLLFNLNKNNPEFSRLNNIAFEAQYKNNLLLLELTKTYFDEREWIIPESFIQEHIKEKIELFNPKIKILRTQLEALKNHYPKFMQDAVKQKYSIKK